MIAYTKKALNSILDKLGEVTDELNTLLEAEDERHDKLALGEGDEASCEESEAICDAIDEALDGVSEAVSVLEELFETEL